MSFKNFAYSIDSRYYTLLLIFLTLCFLKLDYPSLSATSGFIPGGNLPLNLAQYNLDAFCDSRYGQVPIIHEVDSVKTPIHLHANQD